MLVKSGLGETTFAFGGSHIGLEFGCCLHFFELLLAVVEFLDGYKCTAAAS